jgi:hypothetical protein
LFKKSYFDARELLKKAYSQGFEVGTFYFFNSGEVNRHTPLLEPVYSSNLCAEIMEHTREYQEMKDLYTDGPVGYVRILDEYDQDIKMDYNKKIIQNGQIRQRAPQSMPGVRVPRLRPIWPQRFASARRFRQGTFS